MDKKTQWFKLVLVSLAITLGKSAAFRSAPHPAHFLTEKDKD